MISRDGTTPSTDALVVEFINLSTYWFSCSIESPLCAPSKFDSSTPENFKVSSAKNISHFKQESLATGRTTTKFQATWLWFRATWLRARWLSGELTVIRRVQYLNHTSQSCETRKQKTTRTEKFHKWHKASSQTKAFIVCSEIKIFVTLTACSCVSPSNLVPLTWITWSPGKTPSFSVAEFSSAEETYKPTPCSDPPRIENPKPWVWRPLNS